MSVKVYQINDDQTLEAMYPAVPMMYGFGKFDVLANLDKYELVAELDCDDLDDAFEIGNIGPEELYTRFAPMHSVSVGDILELDCGTKYVVANCGFDKVAA